MSGAGFLVVKKETIQDKEPLMLALVRDDGLLDIPKGTIDPGESSLEAAKRECFEECSIVIDFFLNIEENVPYTLVKRPLRNPVQRLYF